MGERSRRRRARRAWLVPLTLPLVRALAAWVRRRPPRAAQHLGWLVGRLISALGLTRPVVRENLRRVCGRDLGGPELRRFEARYYLHFGLMLVEFFRQPLITRETLARHFEPEGLDLLRRVHAEGRGVICVSGHAGLWELAGHAAGLVGLDVLSVAKLTGHAGVDAFVTGIRESGAAEGRGGQRIRDVHGSLWAMKKALDRKQAVGINVDQVVRQGVVFAPFFGIPVATSSAPAALHLRTGAPLVVGAVVRRAPFRYALEVPDVIRHAPTGDKERDLEAVTARINHALEAVIRRHPDQWLWGHRRWRRRPPDEPAPYARVEDVPPLAL